MAENPHAPEHPETGRLSLEELCQDILERHHAHAHVAVPRIRAYLADLADREPGAVPPALRTGFVELAEMLVSHLAKEENILFPAFMALGEAERTGRARPSLAFPTVLHPIRLMESEHVRLAAALDRLATLTNGFTAPAGASDGVRRLMAELGTFRDHLQLHLRVEDDVLFPMAMELDRRL